MSYALSLVARKAVLPLLALLLGGLLYAPATLVEHGTCRTFDGGASGNDPDAETTLVMCRCGDRLYGRLRVQGQAGLSVGELFGRLEGERVVFDDTRPLVSRPNPGWTFCYDDDYELTWDPRAERLSGTYRSAQCDDTGTLVLRPRS